MKITGKLIDAALSAMDDRSGYVGSPRQELSQEVAEAVSESDFLYNLVLTIQEQCKRLGQDQADMLAVAFAAGLTNGLWISQQQAAQPVRPEDYTEAMGQ